MKYKFNLPGQCPELPPELVDYLNSVGCAIDVFTQVGDTCLSIPLNEPDPDKGGMGPAERFLQFADFTADNRPFILTSISLANEKEDRDFDKAIAACEAVTIAAIKKYWPTAGRVQIYVQCALSNEKNTASFLKEHVSYYIDAATGRKSDNQFHDPLEEKPTDRPYVSPTWKMERSAT